MVYLSGVRIGTALSVAVCMCVAWPSSPLAQEAPEFTPPLLLEFVPANYPARAVSDGVEAEVIVQIDIDADGRVEAVEVATPAAAQGYGFDAAALAAVERFVFQPATEDGAPVPVRLMYRYVFKLEPATPEPEPEPPAGDPGSSDPVQDPVDAPSSPSVVNLRGEALERGTRDPLIGVIVTVFQGEGDDAVGYEAETDAEGGFVFRDLPPGPWKILIEPKGYFPFRTTERVEPDQVTEVTCYVERGIYNPFDVVVEGERGRKVVTRRTLQAEEIARIPGTFGDPIKVVENLPGVARTNPLSGEIIVRGSSSEDTKLYIGSVGVPIIYHFGGLRSVIPVGMVESIDFYPGNFSVYYGRAIGGVLDINVKELQPDRVHGYADVNLFDSGVYLEAPLGDTASIAVATRRSYIDFVLDAVIPDDAPINLITAPRYYDYQVLGTWRPDRNHRLQLFVFGSDDELRVVVDNPAFDVNVRSNAASASTNFVRGILDYEWTPSQTFRASTKIATGLDTLNFNGFGIFLFDFAIYQPSLRQSFEWDLSKKAKLKTGIDAVWSKVDILIMAPGTPPKEGDAGDDGGSTEDILSFDQRGLRSRDVAGYAELELSAFEDLVFIPGGRVDYFETLDDFTFDPRLAVRYAVTDEWTAKGGVGLFHQAPGPDETAEGGFGNPDLGAEAAVHYSVGTEYKPLPHLLVDTTLFYKDMFDLVARSDAVVERDGEATPEVYNNEGVGRVYGLELLVRHEFANRFFGWITYTLSRAERLDPGESDYRLFDFDQTHILTLVGSYQLPRNWEVAARWRYVTGSPTTPFDGGVFNVDTYEYEPVPGKVNSARFEDFHQLDLRVDKRWIYDTWKLNLYLDVQNLYNRSNVEGYQYNFDYSERVPSQGLPILPILGIKGEF